METNVKRLTIFTPSYNRAHTLHRTYQSLCNQTCRDFEWLIIDDGSTDNTREIIEKWIDDAIIPIRYLYQENQGMHGAHNTAYKNIYSELNTCIDSDDWMPDNAVDLILKFWKKHGDSKYAGIIGLDCRTDGSVIGTEFPEGMTSTTLSGFYAAGGRGDKKLVLRTDVVKNYPEYPIFEGERYVGLNYLYYLIDRDFSLLTLNKPLVIVDYQQDGSSFNMYNQYWKNPKGFAFVRKTEMVYAPTFKRRFVSSIHYVAESIIAKEKNYIKQSPKPFLCLAAWLPGLSLFFHIKNKVKKGAKYNIDKKV